MAIGMHCDTLLLALGLALAACTMPEGAVVPPSPEAAAAPRPDLIETARFRSALAAAEPDAAELASLASGLQARAAALRARAGALQGPVLDPATRARLEAARTGPPA